MQGQPRIQVIQDFTFSGSHVESMKEIAENNYSIIFDLAQCVQDVISAHNPNGRKKSLLKRFRFCSDKFFRRCGVVKPSVTPSQFLLVTFQFLM